MPSAGCYELKAGTLLVAAEMRDAISQLRAAGCPATLQSKSMRSVAVGLCQPFAVSLEHEAFLHSTLPFSTSIVREILTYQYYAIYIFS